MFEDVFVLTMIVRSVSLSLSLSLSLEMTTRTFFLCLCLREDKLFARAFNGETMVHFESSQNVSPVTMREREKTTKRFHAQ
jgi:hypothetical protein